jgi:hypothetical protein
MRFGRFLWRAFRKHKRGEDDDPIQLALDLKGGRMFMTDFGGSVYSANLDGSNRKTLLIAEGNLTGIAYEELPFGTRTP